MVLEIHQLRGSPRCEVPIIIQIVWSGNPILSISLTVITLSFTLDIMDNIIEYAHNLGH